MNIHHATRNRAEKMGFEIVDLGNTIRFTYNGKTLAEGSNPRVALDEAITEYYSLPAQRKARKATPTAKGAKPPSDDQPKDKHRSVVAETYKATYRQNNDTCGDELAIFLTENFKPDGAFLAKDFIRFVKENNIDPGQFAVIATANPTDLPHGFTGRARMTLRNKLKKLATSQGHLVLNGRKHKFE